MDDPDIDPPEPVRCADDMAPRTTTLRFDEAAHEIIKAAAKRAGVSTAQFMREAVIVRSVLTIRREEGKPVSSEEAIQSLEDFVAILAEVQRLSSI